VVSLLACASTEVPQDPFPTTDIPPFIRAGDLSDIRESGTLRVLYPRLTHTPHLPRRGHTIDLELELATSYAKSQGLEPVFIYVDSRESLIPSLLEGKGDLIAANLTVTPARKDRVAFTVPLAMVREQLVARSDEVRLDDIEAMVGRRVAVRRSSSFWETVEGLRDLHPGIQIETVPEDLETEEIIHRVALGAYDLTVADSNLVESCRQYRQDFRAAFDLTPDRPIGWAVRPDAPALLASLNRFLTHSQLTTPTQEVQLGDWPEIKQRRVLRVLTRNTAASYFLWRGHLMGFEYDLAREFARRHRLRLEIIVPGEGEDLLTMLREGRGDIVAAALTPTEERRRSGVEFSRSYNKVTQVVVAREYESVLDGIQDLAGRKLHVRRNSSYWATLERLRDEEGIDLTLAAVREDMETEEIIHEVGEGTYDLTLADSHIVDIELSWQDKVKAAFAIGEPVDLAWAVRNDNPELLAQIDAFLGDVYRGEFYNVKYNQYFRNRARMLSHSEERAARTGGFSPYDELVKKYAKAYDFDWRLIVSMMYQESRFNPHAESFAGAVGLMQILPRTAEELGFIDLQDPEEAIHAGVAYLNWLRDRFEPELPVQDRMWFSLAAYNAGPGHVRDARRLASRLGKDPNRWFDSVESAMALLARQQYAEQAQHGYCRGTESVRYVRDVRDRYNAYVRTVAVAF